MGKILIIVESNKKCSTITKELGNKYKVVPSVGHIMRLKKSCLGFDENFDPVYEQCPDKKDTIKKLIKEAKEADDVYLAADLDREGENISWCLAQVLKLKNPKRLRFSNITKKTLLKAMDNPGEINQELVNSQVTRSILDMMIGLKLSPLLKEEDASCGRVMSVISKLIIDRENQIKEFFDKEECSYFKISCDFLDDNDFIFNANMYDYETKNIAHIDDKNKTMEILESFLDADFIHDQEIHKTSYRNAPPPYITSSYQKDVCNRFGISLEVCMKIAQKLYEEGLITYMRTSYEVLSEEAVDNIKEYVIQNYGNEYSSPKNNWDKKNKIKKEEAHEAIRPTNINLPELGDQYNDIEKNIYNMIWKRAIASQMSPAEIAITNVIIKISNIDIYKEICDKYYFSFNTEKIVFLGFLMLGANNDNHIEINISEKYSLNSMQANQEYKNPKKRYSPGELVEKLGKMEIGTSATHAPTITKLINKKHIEINSFSGIEKESYIINWSGKFSEKKKKIKVGKDDKKFFPTDKAKSINDFLNEHFSDIFDYEFTAEMEKKLDKIAKGKIDWKQTLITFYEDLKPKIEKLCVIKDDSNLIGKHPTLNHNIYYYIGKFGPCLKMDTGNKIQYASLPENATKDISLEDAVKLFEFPKELGKYEKKMVTLNKGQYGLYLKYDKKSYNINKNYGEDIELEEAILIIKNNSVLFEKKEKGITYAVKKSPYGKYISVKNKEGKTTNYKFNGNDDDLSIEKIKELIKSQYKSKNGFYR